MTQYNTLKIQLSNSQLSKLKSGIKNDTEVTLKRSSNVAGDSNDENNFPHKLLLTNAQTSKLRKVFSNSSSANLKVSKTQLHKIGQSAGSLGRLLGPLLTNALPLIKNELKPLVKSVLIPLRLTAASSVTDAVEVCGLLTKGISKTTRNKEEEKRHIFQNVIRYIRC